jgi:hypothetical protein
LASAPVDYRAGFAALLRSTRNGEFFDGAFDFRTLHLPCGGL